jgi:hypothetical protein
MKNNREGKMKDELLEVKVLIESKKILSIISNVWKVSYRVLLIFSSLLSASAAVFCGDNK